MTDAHIVREGNAFYEIDDECLKKKMEQEEAQKKGQERNQNHFRNQAAEIVRTENIIA